MKQKASILLGALLLLSALALAACGGRGSTPADGESFVMTATICAIGEQLEVEVTDGPYGASGPYTVITHGDTAYYNKDGKKITRGDLSVGDTVSITYGGQVMMSYPPKIVASRVAIK